MNTTERQTMNLALLQLLLIKCLTSQIKALALCFSTVSDVDLSSVLVGLSP